VSDELKFDCSDCVGFCCAGFYRVTLRGTDLARLALNLNLPPAEVERRYTDGARTLLHKPDPLFGEACVFLDLVERRCTVYKSRPSVCREWPRPEDAAPGAEGRCCFYDLYTHVRREQSPQAMPLVQIVSLQGATHPATLSKDAASGEAERGVR